ncbi:MAG: hypothetical protein QOJ79_643 [Actinomycetota bacterium]|jgi:hypothetical protein|nr:hypothetical protein [Actinomycetota bacterium]
MARTTTELKQRPSGRRQPLRDATLAAQLDAAPRSTVQLEAALVAEVDAQAEIEGTNRAALTRKALRLYLAQARGEDVTMKVVTLAVPKAG